MFKKIKNSMTARVAVGVLAAGAVFGGGAVAETAQAAPAQAYSHSIDFRLLPTGWQGRNECWSVNVYTPSWLEKLRGKTRYVTPGKRVSMVNCPNNGVWV